MFSNHTPNKFHNKHSLNGLEYKNYKPWNMHVISMTINYSGNI